jgi:long-chain acyl-CoA synthetase
MNMGSLLPRHACFRGDHTALVVGERRLSYRQLNAYVNRLANAFLAAGLGKGDKLTTVVVVQHPAVQEAAVFGATDARWGEVPVAAVVLKKGAAVGRDDLIAWTNARVAAKFQRIVDVVFFEEFPRNVAGKTLKREMRDTCARP